MDLNLITFFLCLAAYAAIVISVIIKFIKNKEKKIVILDIIRNIFILILVLMIILLTRFIRFGDFETVIIRLCAVLGGYIVAKEAFSKTSESESENK